MVDFFYYHASAGAGDELSSESKKESWKWLMEYINKTDR
jgi:hypothetical protein